MSITRNMIKKLAKVLELEMAIINTKHDDLGEERSALVLDTHAKAMARIERALPSGVCMDDAISQAQAYLDEQNEEAQRGRDARKLRRERIAEKQAALS